MEGEVFFHLKENCSISLHNRKYNFLSVKENRLPLFTMESAFFFQSTHVHDLEAKACHVAEPSRKVFYFAGTRWRWAMGEDHIREALNIPRPSNVLQHTTTEWASQLHGECSGPGNCLGAVPLYYCFSQLSPSSGAYHSVMICLVIPSRARLSFSYRPCALKMPHTCNTCDIIHVILSDWKHNSRSTLISHPFMSDKLTFFVHITYHETFLISGEILSFVNKRTCLIQISMSWPSKVICFSRLWLTCQ